MSRLYRLAVSGKLPTNELTQLVYSLKEIRNAIEAEREAATLDMPAGGVTTEVNVYCIPRGVQFTPDGQTLIWPETGAPADPLPFTPFEATPDWTRQVLTDQSQAIEPLPVHAMPDDPKITRLDSWKRDEPGTA